MCIGAGNTPGRLRAIFKSNGVGKTILNVKKETPLLPLISAYGLALWALQGKQNGDGYGFPFDRSLLCFAERLLQPNQQMPRLIKLSKNDKSNNIQYLYKLYWTAAEVAEDPEIKSLIEEMRWRSATFDSLRKTMRIALASGTNGLNDEGAANIGSIREGVTKFRKSLDQNERLASDPLCGKMAEQIDKYLHQLFNDPIEVDTPSGSVVLYPQRTNNILEHFFRELSRDNRRKTGNNSKQRMLKNMLVDTPLVKNLANPDNMSLLLNGKTDLEQLFASMNPISLNRELQSGVDRILPGFRKIVKLPALPDYFIRLAADENVRRAA